jgi:hypothetical protein
MMQDVRIQLNVWAKSSIQKEESFHQQVGLQFKEKPDEILHLEHGCLWCSNLNSSESRSGITEKFLMWCWRRTEKISWTDCMRYGEVLQRGKEERSILLTYSMEQSPS